jgi:two-component system, OmpR family, sensor histidine kinase CpxA
MTAAIVNISMAIWSLVQPPSPRTLSLDVLHVCAESAMDKYQRGGPDALSRYLAQADSGCPGAVLVDATNTPPKDVLNPKLPRRDFKLAEEVRSSGKVTFQVLPWRAQIALPVEPGTSSSYVYIATAWAMEDSFLLRVKLQLIPVTLAAGILCYFLTLYFGRPLTRLGRMAEELGAGDLSARIDDSLAKRKDEFGDLAQSFNRMAGKIETLVADYKNFLAHVSHELGSPLTRVNIALALARRKADPLLEPELDRIDYETNHLNMLVEELLLLARLESGNELSRQTTSFNIASVIEEACADARFEATQIQKSIVVERQEDFNIIGYRDLLRRALDNVLRNGLRFARESGCIRVEFFASSGGAVGMISIRDDGPGINPDQEQAIFEPFVTLPNRGAVAGTGSGLGLAIARQAVLVNGGKICARNSEHGGLTVTIELPVSGHGLTHNSV